MRLKPGYAPFYSALPASSLLKFHGAVFLVFAPLMMLTSASVAEGWTWTAVLFWLAAPGLIAVGWAASFMHKPVMLALVIPTQIALVMAFSSRWPPGVGVMRPSVMGVGAALLVAAGYVLFVMFISGEGVRVLRLQTEMNLAQRIHAGLVPLVHRTFGAAEVYGRSAASTEMGGDLLDVVDDGGHIGVYLADVSGHGVRAGVLMAMIKSALRMRLGAGGELGRILADLNRNVGELAEPGMFATFACVRLSEGRRAECALAGHLPILRFDATRGVLGRIENEHLPLGVSQDERYEAKEVACGAGDLLVLLTDGLTEVQDSHGKELGLAAMEATIAEHAAEPLERLHERVVGVARDHGRQLDDQTLVLVRVL